MHFPFSHNTDFFLWKRDNHTMSLVTETGGAEDAQAKSTITLLPAPRMEETRSMDTQPSPKDKTPVNDLSGAHTNGYL